MMMVATMVAFTSCDSDRDSNPELLTPTEFTVNNPAVGDALVDLEKSKSVELTWSQPQFTAMNAPVAAKYQVQVSSTGSFTTKFNEEAEDNSSADYVVLDDVYSLCKVDVPTASIATALAKLNKWDEDQVPAEQKVSMRVRAFVQDASMVTLSEVTSNVVTINAVPYYVVLTPADPVLWNLIGGDIGDGLWKWDIPTSSLPMQPIKDGVYDKKTGEGVTEWVGYLGGNGLKLNLGEADNWTNQVGTDGVGGPLVLNNGGSKDIKVAAPGVYRVTFNSTGAQGAPGNTPAQITIEPYEGNAPTYSKICLTGDYNGWLENGNAMSPVHTCAGENNHDWYLTIENPEGGKVKFNNGTWGTNWGVDAGGVLTFSTGDLYGWGAAGGGNIALPAGKYTVIFNDITGYYRFIPQN